jgi:predicted dehydrogenase
LSGRLGKIKECYAAACWPRDDKYYNRNDWSAKRAVNGVTTLDSPLNNACAHYLNLLLFLNSPERFGTARCVDVSGEVLRARPEIEMFDACDICYTLENGIRLNVAFVHCCQDHLDAQLHIICEKGRIFWRSNADWEVKDADGQIIASGMGELPVEAMFRRVVAKLDDPSLPVYTLENGMEHTACVEMLDKKVAITPVDSEKIDGIYCVPGIRDRIAAALPEQR